MTLIIPDGFGQVIHQLRLVGDLEPMAVTYGIKVDGGGVTAPDTLADGLHEAFYTAWNVNMSNQYTLYQTEVKWKDVALADVSVVVHVEPKVMTSTASPCPQNVAFLIQKLSGMAGRRNRGRMYVPGVNEANVGPSGLLLGTEQSGLNTKLAAWCTTLSTSIGQCDGMAILHSTGLSGAPAPTMVNSLLCDALVATQRRRLRK